MKQRIECCALVLLSTLALSTQSVVAVATRTRAPRLRGEPKTDKTLRSLKKGGRGTYFSAEKDDDFILPCQTNLSLVKEKNGMLSQADYASFLHDFCMESPFPGTSCLDSAHSFWELDPRLQRLFVSSTCRGGPVEQEECLEFLFEKGDNFGYTSGIDGLCEKTNKLLAPSGLICAKQCSGKLSASMYEEKEGQVPQDLVDGEEPTDGTEDGKGQLKAEGETIISPNQTQMDTPSSQNDSQQGVAEVGGNAVVDTRHQDAPETDKSPTRKSESDASPTAESTLPFPGVTLPTNPIITQPEKGSAHNGLLVSCGAAFCILLVIAVKWSKWSMSTGESIKTMDDPDLDGDESIISENSYIFENGEVKQSGFLPSEILNSQIFAWNWPARPPRPSLSTEDEGNRRPSNQLAAFFGLSIQTENATSSDSDSSSATGVQESCTEHLPSTPSVMPTLDIYEEALMTCSFNDDGDGSDSSITADDLSSIGYGDPLAPPEKQDQSLFVSASAAAVEHNPIRPYSVPMQASLNVSLEMRIPNSRSSTSTKPRRGNTRD